MSWRKKLYDKIVFLGLIYAGPKGGRPCRRFWTFVCRSFGRSKAFYRIPLIGKLGDRGIGGFGYWGFGGLGNRGIRGSGDFGFWGYLQLLEVYLGVLVGTWRNLGVLGDNCCLLRVFWYALGYLGLLGCIWGYFEGTLRYLRVHLSTFVTSQSLCITGIKPRAWYL